MKKRIFLIFLVLCLSSALWAQDIPSLDEFQVPFETFASEIANSLPMASTIGLQWSDAYIKNFPHLGFGVSAGGVLLPVEAFDALSDFLPVGDFDVSNFLPATFPSWLAGIPFPAYAVDFRLGGFKIPFDLGFKIGFIPKIWQDDVNNMLSGLDMELDYLLIGGDFRYALLKQNKKLRPNLSIGAGYNFFRGGVGKSLTDYGTSQILSVPDPDNLGSTIDYTVGIEDPSLNFGWTAHVIDAKVQLSKRILYIMTPYVGVGASYARATAGGGIEANVTGITDAEISELNAALAAAGQEPLDISDQGIIFEDGVNGWAFRAYGGLSLNIFWLKIDPSVMYNFIDQTVGFQVSVRLQF